MTLPADFPFERVFVLTGASAAGWSRAQMSDLCQALAAAGLEAELVPVEAGPGFLDRAAQDRRPFFAIDSNQKVKLPDGVRKVSLMLDHPCTRIDDLIGGNPRDVALGWVCQSHVAAAQALGLPFRSQFLPHAGPAPAADPLPMADRDIDIFFAGGLADMVTPQTWLEANPGVDPVVAEVIFNTAMALYGARDGALAIFVAIAARHGIDVPRVMTADRLCRSLTRIIEISEANRRLQVLQALPSSLSVTIVGDYLPELLRGRPNLTFLGPIDDFAEIRRLMGRSRIVLNSTNKFPQGSHERIWYAMAEGAVVLTDPSTFMSQDFAHGRDILYLPAGYDLTAVAAEVSDLAQDAARLEKVAAAARAAYANGHTWQHRLGTLFDLAAGTV